MKTIRIITQSTITALVLAGVALNFNACSEQSPLASQGVNEEAVTLSKRPTLRATANDVETDNTSGTTTETGSLTPKYFKKWGEYNGGRIILSQGSQFELLYGSLNPPDDLKGKNVTLTMTVVQDHANNDLLFEFGPHGSTFEPAATV
jgi:branched-subunit amino acid aminotransferase/4-amino-4-deoxychorismate lyase